MKRTLSLFLSLVMTLCILTSVPVTVSAANVEDLTFELNEDGKSYTVTDCDESSSGEIVIPDTYKGLIVTKIGCEAFYECKKLTSIIIPDCVTFLGPDVFRDCTNLTTITLSDGITTITDGTFTGCTHLKSVTIPNTVTSIGDNVFSGCTNLVSVTIPNTVTRIGWFAFSECTSLSSITLSKGLTYLGLGAFRNCTSLTSVKIPDGVTVIEESTFAHCSTLTSVTIPDSVSWIVTCAFYDCKKLESIIIPDSVTNIGEYALGYFENKSTNESCKIPSFTIYGIKGTVAETYAKENEFEFIDVNHTHASSSWITDTAATVYKAGSKHKECTECGETLETETIAQLKCAKPKLKKISNTADGVKITWGTVSGADSYVVYRKTGSKGKYSKLTTTTKTGYTDKKASSGKKYYYYVKAVNEVGSSSASSSKSIYYLADATLKTPKSTKSGVTLNWTQITGADGYMVYRKTGSGDYKKLTTVKGVKKVKYTDKSAKKGKTYTYKIKAYKSKTYSAYSNAKKIKDKY